jgi:ABC-type transporter Mla MlaB component
VGLFSFLSRKNEPPESPINTVVRTGEPSRLTSADTEAERARQREISRATAAKIDAIELEMTSDIFNQPEPGWRPPGQRVIQPGGVSLLHTPEPGPELETPSMMFDTPEAAVAPASAPIEESAILYASGELAGAEAILHDALAGAARAERRIWWMLFDLYQGQGREDDFNNIAIDYASTFETSPPGFQKRSSGTVSGSGVAPTATLSGTLDEQSAPALARLLAAPAESLVLRIEVDQVRAVTEAGCAQLLSTLQALRKQGRPLVVAGAETLANLLRPALVVGDTSTGESPWLLRVELLQILRREKDFEEAAMDYCVTFEVSPPSFEPNARVGSAAPANGGAASGDQFLLPAIIDGDCAFLMAAIGAFGAANNPAVLDCANLARIDYGCAAVLVEKLRVLHQAEVQVELRGLNHLVAELLRLLGGPACARLYPHRY